MVTTRSSAALNARAASVSGSTSARRPSSDSSTSSFIAVSRLIGIFLAWKTFLLLVAVASPGPGYDTSTDILFRDAPPSIARRIALSVTRWDSIYFAAAAHRGHVYEQEWAFSPFLALWTGSLAQVMTHDSSPSLLVTTLIGVALAHAAHLVAVLCLFGLTLTILPTSFSTSKKQSIAFTAASLHVFSPGGLFLSAVNGESAYAALSFAGLWIYAAALSPTANARHPTTRYLAAYLPPLTGVFFGLASLVRSNGLLTGLILLLDLLSFIPEIPDMLRLRSPRAFLMAASIGASGILLGAAYAYGQLDAYLRFCIGDIAARRPWCAAFPPSIYTFVQHHYWHNGLLAYWTLSNLPLFLLAAPMLIVLCLTAYVAVGHAEELLQLVDETHAKRWPQDRREDRFIHVLRRLAIPQTVLAVLVALNSHVQIINRISSGYPLWYIVLAMLLHVEDHGMARQRRMSAGLRLLLGEKRSRPRSLVIVMVMYAVVQGGLYASFLPPA